LAQEITLSGIGQANFKEKFYQSLASTRPAVVGIAAAFVSTEGVRQLVRILRACGEPACRLVAGTDNAITHPQALYSARDQGWDLRLGRSNGGIFHPKLIIAGDRFARNGGIPNLSSVYVGSSNLTNGGLTSNVECGFIASSEGCLTSASVAFAELWRAAGRATDADLRNYAARFAERSRIRSIAELADLGVSDGTVVPAGDIDLAAQQPPAMPALGAEFAVAAWAGLQSFTGQYRFQLEFPKGAGQVVRQLVSAHAHADGRVDVYCPDDESTRPVQYKYYPQNSMFRLNMPNDVPGVAWARAHRDGIAIIERGPAGGALLRIRLLRPGADAREIVGRSAMLGTWGRTTTRPYGWF
jgi:HKD family nuclease